MPAPPPPHPTPRTNLAEWGAVRAIKKRSRHASPPRGERATAAPVAIPWSRSAASCAASRWRTLSPEPRRQRRPPARRPTCLNVQARGADRRPPLDQAARPVSGCAHGPRRAAVPSPIRGRVVEAAREKNVAAHGVGRPTRRAAAAGWQRQRRRRLRGEGSRGRVEAAQPAVATQRLVRQRVDDGRGGGARRGGQFRRPGALKGAIASRPAHSERRGKKSRGTCRQSGHTEIRVAKEKEYQSAN